MQIHLPCGSFALVVDSSMWRYSIYAFSSSEKFGCMATMIKQTCWRFENTNSRLTLNGKASVEMIASYDCHSPYSSLNVTVIPDNEPLMRYDYFIMFCGNQPTFSSETVYGIGKDRTYSYYSGVILARTMSEIQDFNRHLFSTIKFPLGMGRGFFL